MRRLSVVIPNYNYAAFIADAIDSALALDWPDVEVIVVDDGSTDDSRTRIEAYGPRITAIFQENAGPRVACNAGYAVSSGDAVVFLDSDDVLEPTLAREVAAVWRPGVTKVQVSMQRIDREGAPSGGVFPEFARTPTPEQIRTWMRRSSAYPTPPGSGNVYAREYLEKLFPLGDECGDATDSACLAAAPFLGDVLTIPKPLVRYRQHGDNRSHLLADHTRFARQLERAHQRHTFAQRVSGTESDGIGPLFRGRHLLQVRIAHHKLRPNEFPLPGDSRWRMFRNAVASPFVPGPESARQRALVAAWSLVTLAAPRTIGSRLVDARFRQGGAGVLRRRAHGAGRVREPQV